MTAKKIILITSFSLVLFLGIYIGESEYFENSFKSIFINIFIEKELENPLIYEENILDLIEISNKNEVENKRSDAVNYIWKTNSIPRDSFPNNVETNIIDEAYENFSNLEQIDKITINMKHDINSIAYHFIPTESNNKIIIYVQGHDGGFILGKKTIERFLGEGYSVMAFSMPLIGMNNQPIVDTNVGKIIFLSHKYFELVEEESISPLIYFFEPINASLNYLDKKYDYDEINAIGISGGGWTVTLYSAMDERVSKTFSVAGGVPFFMRGSEKNIGDYEQRINEFYDKVNYLEFYIMSSLGQERKYVQIFNKFDPCCFSGDKFYMYDEIVKKKIKDIGDGYFYIYIDEETRLHEISDFSLEKISIDLEN